MPKVLPEYLELRRQQILDAAAACFTRNGFHQTTMQDICEQADLSPGAVYRYFRSKTEIIQAMCFRGQMEDVETIRTAMTEGTTLAVFEELIRSFFNELDNREICALTVELLAEARKDDVILDSIRSGWQAIRAPLAEIIRRAQSRGEIDPSLDAAAVATVMMALYQGLLNQKLVDPETDIATYSDAVRALFGGRFWQATDSGKAPSRSSALSH
jgi:AcrR family transcriptional regulator